MLNEDPGGISFSEIGGLGDQIRELREVIELPLTNPELFIRVGIKPPKVMWTSFECLFGVTHVGAMLACAMWRSYRPARRVDHMLWSP